MSDPVDFPGEATAGISEADQREIREEIERVAAENRIKVSPDLLSYTAERNGALFPLLINLAGVLFLVAGLGALFFFFRSDEETIRGAEQSVAATESRLIQEIRRETEARLAEKETEIEQIVARLESIDQQRLALAEDMEGQISQRVEELEQQFEAELEAERRRLEALNLSEAEVEARLAEFEAQKRQEYNERIAQFRERMVAERQRLEEDLDVLERQFSETLEQANQERTAILQESEARIGEIQNEFEARLALSEAELTEAQRELARLSQSRERETLIRGQITGLYASVSEDIQEGAYESALDRLESLETLLNESSTLQIETLRQERGANLFLLRTLREYIRNVQRTTNPETIARLNEANLLREVALLNEEAAEALAAGDEELAANLYRQAVETIPTVAESYRFLVAQQGSGGAVASAAEEAAAEELIAEAQESLETGEAEEALEAYTRVLQLYPTSRFRGEAVAGVRTTVSTLQEDLEAEIVALTAEQESLQAALDAGGAGEGAQVAVLRQEVSSLETRNAQLEGQLSTLTAQRDALETQRETLRAQIATLQQQRDQRQNRIGELESRVTTLDTEIRRLEASITERDQALAESRRAEARLREQLAAVETGEAGAVDAATLAELDRLRDVEAQIDQAENLYASYRSVAAAMPSEPEGVELVESRLRLDEFLGSPAVSGFFPELLEEVRRYETAYERSGRENAMVEVADLIYELSLLPEAADRLERIRSERAAAEQPIMRDFLDELELLLDQG